MGQLRDDQGRRRRRRAAGRPGAGRHGPRHRRVQALLRRPAAPQRADLQVPLQHPETHLFVLGHLRQAGVPGHLRRQRADPGAGGLPLRAALQQRAARPAGGQRRAGRPAERGHRAGDDHVQRRQDPVGGAAHRHHHQGRRGRHPDPPDRHRRAGPDRLQGLARLQPEDHQRQRGRRQDRRQPAPPDPVDPADRRAGARGGAGGGRCGAARPRQLGRPARRRRDPGDGAAAPGRGPLSPPRSRAGLWAAVALAALALAPLLARGYVLAYDMVFVPRIPLGRDLLGLGTSVARAVPSDLLVALASRVAPAELVQKLILVGIFVFGGWGAARLAPVATAAGGAAAAGLFIWNAHVYERLLMGHWALLVSYAALPWVVGAALDYRAGRARAHRLVAALAVAACGSPPGAVIAAGTALAVVAGRPWRRAGTVLAAALALNLPWLLPSVLRSGGVPVRPAGAAAFASRPDGPFGTLGSLLGLGGIWNGLVTPPGHGAWAWWPGFAVVLAVAVIGWLVILRRWDRGAAVGLLVGAAVGLALAGAYAVPALRGAVDFAIAHVPGGGMIRDAQKFVAPLALVEAIGFGAGVERVLGMLEPSRWRVAAAGAMGGGPGVLVTGPAGGAAGGPGSAAYPPDWRQARQAMAADPEPGEDPYGGRLGPLVRGAAPLAPALAAQGIRYVLVLKVAEWAEFTPRLAGAQRLLDGADLALYRVPGPAAAVRFAAPPAAPVVAGDLLALATAAWAVVGVLPVVALWRRRLLLFARAGEGSHR